MNQSLDTTNLILGIIAAAAVVQVLIIVGGVIAGYMVYRRMSTLTNELQASVAPAMHRVNLILDDVREVSGTVKMRTVRAEQAIHHTMDRVDETVDRVRHNVRAKTGMLVGLVRGARVAIETMLQSRAA
jgi:hypothetical protein